ncbi:FAD-binding oxidoreductase [Variovorax sp. RT4R15]|uniref:FAD-binding oxidoreductase n=1 Tax=Variovorax sp. RT4R15 TaxID=3443737 RepID=UPI003F46DF72
MSEYTMPSDVGRILTSPEEVFPFTRDYTGRFTGPARCVVLPTETAEVSRLLRWCSANGVPVVAQGGNTGLAGGATPDCCGQAIVLSVTRMSRLRALNLADSTVTVEAGMVLQTLQDIARDTNRFFPLALGSQGTCTIGGNLSANAGGTGVLRYGNMRELCLGLEVVTPTGEVFDGLRSLRKDNSGYDLRDLYIGAEGTIGITTAATLKLYSPPKARGTTWVAQSSLEQTLRLLTLAQQALGTDLTAFELMSDYCIQLVGRKLGNGPKVFANTFAWYVLMESSDQESEAHAIGRFESLMADAFEQGVIENAAIAQSEAQSLQFWRIRERIGLSRPKNIKHDISLPIGQVANFVERMEKLIESIHPGCWTVVLGHLGDGNLHYNVEPIQELEDSALLALDKQVHRTVYDEVDRLRGSMSAEHGIGAAKVDDLRRYKSDVTLKLMRSIKQALDPQGIPNSGKLLGAAACAAENDLSLLSVSNSVGRSPTSMPLQTGSPMQILLPRPSGFEKWSVTDLDCSGAKEDKGTPQGCYFRVRPRRERRPCGVAHQLTSPIATTL